MNHSIFYLANKINSFILANLISELVHIMSKNVCTAHYFKKLLFLI